MGIFLMIVDDYLFYIFLVDVIQPRKLQVKRKLIAMLKIDVIMNHFYISKNKNKFSIFIRRFFFFINIVFFYELLNIVKFRHF